MVPTNEVTTLAELPRIVSRYLESKTGLIAHDERLTYGELERDSAASIPLLFGTAKAKAVWAGMNFRLSVDEIASIIEDARPEVVFFDAEFASTLQRSL